MIYNPYFDHAGIDAVVIPMGCQATDFPVFLKSVFSLTNVRGALITMPHKVTTVGLLDECSLAVQIAGACNAVRRNADGRLCGDLFDGEGFTRGLRLKGCVMSGASALIVGSGGVGSAIAASLAKAGAARLGLFDVEPGRAASLASRLARHYPELGLETASRDPLGYDIVVNATPMGMADNDELPLDTERIAAGTFVGEVVMKVEMTKFLISAQARGARVQVGTDMLFEQIPAYLEFFGFPTTTAKHLRQLTTSAY